MDRRRYFIISLLLIMAAMTVITASDYWTALSMAVSRSEDYARRVVLHMTHRFFPDSDGVEELQEPGSLEVQRAAIEDLVRSFGISDLTIYNPDAEIVFSLDEAAVGRRSAGSEQLEAALRGSTSSNIVTRSSLNREPSAFPLVQTYIPIRDPEDQRVLGAYEIDQDYRPLREQLFAQTLRSGVSHLILLLVFAGLFFQYGRLTSRYLDASSRSLIRELEDRVEERTLELKRSRDRVSDLLRRKEEMFRNLMIADEYKKNFMGLVSHELRTPLTVIKGYLTMMRDGDFGPVYTGLEDVIATCLDESGKLESIINNILELSQLERGLFDLTAEEFALQELFDEAVQNLADETKGRMEDIRTEVSREVRMFSSDRIKILQVVQQFLSNAIKFSSPGSPVVLRAAPSHRGLLISVSDEGVGIPGPQVNEIFNLFYQVDISTTRSYEGSGLGLAIVHKIAQILGGRAWVESDEGRGSTFHFEVGPFDRPSAASGEGTDLSGREGSAPSRDVAPASTSVLLIDDDEDYLFLLRRILIDGGYTVEMCRNGLDGLNRLFGPNHPRLPAVILLDIRMPNIHGIDLLRILKRNMTTREIPVIVVSALGQESQIQEGYEAGANAYFVKPFDPDTLLARIDFLLGRQRASAGG